MDHGTNLKLANKLEAHKQRNFKQQELGEGKKAKEVSIANLETEKKLSDPDKNRGYAVHRYLSSLLRRNI